MLRILTILAAHAMAYGLLHAQNTFTICAAQEFCFCWDGSLPAPTYTFEACTPGETITVAFCSGQMQTGQVIRSYDGIDDSGAPISALTGQYPNMAGAQGTSATSTFTMELDFGDGAGLLDCMNDLQAPWRWMVYLTPSDTLALPTCIGTDPFCSTTHVPAVSPSISAWVTRSGDQLLLAPHALGSVIELHDASGRLAEVIPTHGRTAVLVPAVLKSGVYVLTMQVGGQRLVSRLVWEH
ncbi:MAG: T9SS type A sorting domain-containing protein [Flavobacteriales bacterium]|nr:T9SS type A sorting domain-containing protein [Flavobacteriales bacterium]